MAAHAWRQGCRWEIAPQYEGAAELGRRLGTAPLVGQLLFNRGLSDEAAAKSFLNPSLNDLHDPELLPGTVAAAERIAAAIKAGEKIVIYGDYDVDGITAVAILHSMLKMFGATVGYYVPHRIEEGYGVNSAAVKKVIDTGAKLMITVDCGISADGPLEEAAAAGLDVIVTDHHCHGDKLPRAVAIVHPANYPNPDLSGAGVAFKLAWQVARVVSGNARVDAAMREFLLEATCLAALGTIADVVPLVGENRVLATFGLRGLPSCKRPGIRALLDSAGLGGKLDAYDVGFKLAPRINACGRMGHARLAVELLTSGDDKRCREIAQYLVGQNEERQKVERAIAQQAAEMVIAKGMDKPECRAIVLSSDAWHSGVIGIVASRLVGRFHRPAILLAINADGSAQGSCRSIGGFHMRDALAACGKHLVGFGGHAMAGGLRIETANIQAFSDAMMAHAAGKISCEQLTPALRLDAAATLAELNHNCVDHISRLAPFGQGNPGPMLAIRSCRLLSGAKRIGQNGKTVMMTLGQEGATIRAVGFSMGDLADQLVGVNTVDVAAQPVINNFNGRSSAELQLHDVQWE